MERMKINVSRRQERGKGFAGRLRKTGSIPAIAYSEEVNIALVVPGESLKSLRAVHFSESTIFDMNIAGQETLSMPVLIKDVQFDPLTEAVTHIDFLQVSLKNKIKVHVPLILKGEAKGIKDEGGILTHALHELEVEGLPLDIPEHIDIDVSQLAVGDSIHAANIILPEGIRMVTDLEATVVVIVAKQEEEAEPILEAGPQEPEVIKEVKPKEGAEPAGGGDKAKAEKKG